MEGNEDSVSNLETRTRKHRRRTIEEANSLAAAAAASETTTDADADADNEADDDDDATAEMAPSSKPRPNNPNPPRRDADLSALLVMGEKVELAALVAKITGLMESRIAQVFEATGSIAPAGTTGDNNNNNSNNLPARPSFWARLPRHLKDMSFATAGTAAAAAPTSKENGVKNAKSGGGVNQKENEKPAQSVPVSVNGSDAKKPDTATTLSVVKSECRDTFGPRLQELKKDALQHFNRWQVTLQKRIDDISVKKPRPATAAAAGSGGPSSLAGGRQGGAGNSGNGSAGGRTRQRGPKPPSEADSIVVTKLYPPIATSLSVLPWEKRCLLLHSILLLLLSLENYSAYSRVLLLHIASSLRLPLRILAEDEIRVASGLSQLAKDLMDDEKAQKRIEESKSIKKWKVDPATVSGTVVAGVTGSLPPPLVAAGIGSVPGGSMALGIVAAGGLLGALTENAVLVCTLLGVYGTRATGKTMEQFVKDVQDFAFQPLRGPVGDNEVEPGKVQPEVRRLRMTLGIGGWLSRGNDVTDPWRAFGEQTEVYAVKWESEALAKMGNALDTLVKSAAWSQAKREITARPIFTAIEQALWPVDLLKISKIIDNPWSVGMVRADKAGAVLADMIMNKVHGERGVTLVGYSLGARVVYSCLMNLGERRALGLVENAVLMGTPAPAEARVWCTMKSVVSGRLVNVYSTNDYLLGFLYRTSSVHFGVAGLQRIEAIGGVENVDVSDKVSNHMRYPYLVGSILKHIGWEDIDRNQVPKDEEALRLTEEKHRERERRRNAIAFDAVVGVANGNNGQEKGGVGAPLQSNNISINGNNTSQGIIQTRFRKVKGKKKQQHAPGP